MTAVDFHGMYDNVLTATTDGRELQKGASYIRFTLTENVNVTLPEGVNVGGSKVRNYKEANFKYIDIPCADYIENDYHSCEDKSHDWDQDESKCFIAYLDKEGANNILIKMKGTGPLLIPSTNIASVDVRIKSYPKNRFHQSLKYRGKKFIKASGITLGFILAITQILFNISAWPSL